MRRMMIGCLGGAPTKSLTNKVSNGDMSNGTTGWRHYSTYSAESIVAGELKSLRTTNRPFVGNTSTWGIPIGRKVYVAAKIYGNKSGNANLFLYNTLGVTESGAVGVIPLTTTPTRFSQIVTTATSVANGVGISGTSFTASGDYLMIDNVIVIDLTAAFGAGSEPSAATMDAALAYLPGSWFDGTQNIIWTA